MKQVGLRPQHGNLCYNRLRPVRLTNSDAHHAVDTPDSVTSNTPRVTVSTHRVRTLSWYLLTVERASALALVWLRIRVSAPCTMLLNDKKS